MYHEDYFIKISSGLRALIIKSVHLKSIQLTFPVTIGYKSKLVIKQNGNIWIGNKSMIYNHVEIQSRNIIKIGSHFSINNYSRIIALDNIEIGDNVTIAQFVNYYLDHNHSYAYENEKLILKGYKTFPVIIGNNVWIADKATILKGVTIGNNVIIGANSLVNKTYLMIALQQVIHAK